MVTVLAEDEGISISSQKFTEPNDNFFLNYHAWLKPRTFVDRD